jgi:signal transduction histidine kinase
LGLFIARHIVQAHGGRIFVDPLHSGGACFVVELTGSRRLGPS